MLGNLTNVHYLAEKAEDAGLIVRPLYCETCHKMKILIKHHRDYDKPLEITWVYLSCHRKEHYDNKELEMPGRKIVQLDPKTHKIIQREAQRQSLKPGFTVTLGGVIAQLAAKLGKKRGKR